MLSQVTLGSSHHASPADLSLQFSWGRTMLLLWDPTIYSHRHPYYLDPMGFLSLLSSSTLRKHVPLAPKNSGRTSKSSLDCAGQSEGLSVTQAWVRHTTPLCFPHNCMRHILVCMSLLHSPYAWGGVLQNKRQEDWKKTPSIPTTWFKRSSNSQLPESLYQQME